MPVTIRALTHLGVDCAGLGTLASVPTLGGETVVGELSALDFLPEVGAVHL